MKRRKKQPSRASIYILLVFVTVIFAIAASATVYFTKYTDPSAKAGMPDTADTLGIGPFIAEAGEIGYGEIFKVNSSSELKALADSGALSDYYLSRSTSATVIVSDGVIFDSDITIPCGIKLLFVGKAEWTNGAKITIKTKDACEIDLTTDGGINEFFIDAPNASVTWTGGNVPFSHELAREMNVGTLNGSPVTYDGDRLGGAGEALFESVKLYTDKNKNKTADASFEVNGNLITLFYPWDYDGKSISKAYIDIGSSGKCTLDTSKAVDLSTPTLVTVEDANGNTRTYRMTAERKSYGIPILEITTSTGGAIDTRDEYIPSVMTLDGETYSLGIKGRGNTSWHSFPKHAYRIKLDEKAKLLGMSANRDWVLIANYVDPSLIRNQIATDIAKKLDGLDFTPVHIAVDLYVNGKYEGMYTLGEKIEDAKNRVDLGDPVTDESGNITDFGFLLELGWDFSSPNVYARDWFNLKYARRIYIKEPDIEKKNDETYKYIYDYVKSAEDAIVSGEGWQEWLDADSWVDWFIVNELCNNTESAMHRSFYMYKPVGGKLTAGPIWDYDIAFGNSVDDLPTYDQGWVAVDSTHKDLYQNWLYFLLRNDDFVSLVKARWAEIGETLYKTALESIDTHADTIKDAVPNNFNRWKGILGKRVYLSRASKLSKTWDGQIDYIRDFIETRYSFMNERLSRDGSILN